MGRTIWGAVCFAAALGLSACMSSGTQVSDQQISQFVRGKTTEREVIATLGQPDYSQSSADGVHMLGYNYTKIAVNGQTFIPIIGSFIASSDMQTRMVTFRFDPNGILVDWSASGSGQTINGGFLNQR